MATRTRLTPAEEKAIDEALDEAFFRSRPKPLTPRQMDLYRRRKDWLTDLMLHPDKTLAQISLERDHVPSVGVLTYEVGKLRPHAGRPLSGMLARVRQGGKGKRGRAIMESRLRRQQEELMAALYRAGLTLRQVGQGDLLELCSHPSLGQKVVKALSDCDNPGLKELARALARGLRLVRDPESDFMWLGYRRNAPEMPELAIELEPSPGDPAKGPLWIDTHKVPLTGMVEEGEMRICLGVHHDLVAAALRRRGETLRPSRWTPSEETEFRRLLVLVELIRDARAGKRRKNRDIADAIRSGEKIPITAGNVRDAKAWLRGQSLDSDVRAVMDGKGEKQERELRRLVVFTEVMADEDAGSCRTYADLAKDIGRDHGLAVSWQDVRNDLGWLCRRDFKPGIKEAVERQRALRSQGRPPKPSE